MKKDTTFVCMRSGDHLGNAKMLKKGTSLNRIKGTVSQYSVIFSAFLREQKMATAHASVADIRPCQLTQPRKKLHRPS